MTSFTLRILVVLSLVLTSAHAAFANPFDVYGFGPRGMAMGNALTAASRDYESVMYNYALLPYSKNSFGIGFHYTFDDVSIDLRDRPAGIDPPGYASRFNERQDNNEFPDNQGLLLGVNHDLGFEWFGIGYAMYFPSELIQVQRTRFNNEIEQYASNTLHFELIGERSQRQVMKVGFGVKPVEFFSLGAGLNILNDSRSDSYVFQPNALDSNIIFISLENDIELTFDAEFGIAIVPSERLSFAYVLRPEMDFPISGTNFVNVIAPFIGQQLSEQPLDFLIQYTPERHAFGAMYMPRENLVLSVDIVFQRWSEYVNNQNEDAVPELDDTVRPSFGAEWKVNEEWTVRGGYYYEQSPIDDTTGRYNYVDNDRHMFSLGGGYTKEIDGVVFNISGYMQWHYLEPRSIVKELDGEFPIIDEDLNTPGLQTGNPGYPGYASKGNIFGAGFMVSVFL